MLRGPEDVEVVFVGAVSSPLMKILSASLGCVIAYGSHDLIVMRRLRHCAVVECGGVGRNGGR